MSSGINGFSLQTQNLILQEISESDAGWIVAWRSDPQVYKYFLKPHPITLREHRHWYYSSYQEDEQRIDMIAMEKGTKWPVGLFGLKKLSSSTAEVNYLLDEEKQGKGYAFEGVRTMIQWAHHSWESKYIIAQIHRMNKSSIKLIDRLGFDRDRREGDFLIYIREL